MKFLDKYGLWWPDFETKTDELMLYLMRKVTDCDTAAGYCKTKGVCVQAGGHIGLWPRQLAKHFSFVYTFEPCSEAYECLIKNTQHCPEVIPHPLGLGVKAETVAFGSRSGGRSAVTATGGEQINVIPLDDLNLLRCDLMYLDVERYELQVLKGARKTIEKYSPVIALEVLQDQTKSVHAFMDELGYRLRTKTHSDEIYTR